MQHEDAEIGRLGGVLLLDPGVPAAADLPVVEVRLRRVDRHHRDPSFRRTELRSPNRSSKWTYPTFRASWFPGTTTNASQTIESRYWRASWYSCLNPNVVRSPEHTTMSGTRSLISEIARSSRAASKYGPRSAGRTGGRSGTGRSPTAMCAQSTAAARRPIGPRRGRPRASLLSRRCPTRPRESAPFQAYRGAEPPRFVNAAELECARILDWYGSLGVRAALVRAPARRRRPRDERVHARFLPPRAGSLHRGHGHEAVPGDEEEPEAPRGPAPLPGRPCEALLPAGHRAARAALSAGSPRERSGALCGRAASRSATST